MCLDIKWSCTSTKNVGSSKILQERGEGRACSSALTESTTSESTPCSLGNVSSELNIDTLIDLILKEHCQALVFV